MIERSLREVMKRIKPKGRRWRTWKVSVKKLLEEIWSWLLIEIAIDGRKCVFTIMRQDNQHILCKLIGNNYRHKLFWMCHYRIHRTFDPFLQNRLFIDVQIIFYVTILFWNIRRMNPFCVLRFNNWMAAWQIGKVR